MLALKFENDSADLLLNTEDEAERLYEALWRLAGTMHGAVTAAAKLRHARMASRAARSDYLNATEGHAVRAALKTLSEG